MDVLSLADAVGSRREEIVKAIRAGKIFIYPTDTIYGIGCDAHNHAAVKKIKQLKRRDTRKPFSVIAPTKGWVREHMHVRHASFLQKLPGRYTFIWEKKSPRFLSSVSAGTTIGIRIPLHPFVSLLRDAGIPFVTTSVNRSGDPPLQDVHTIPLSMRRGVDYVIDAGLLHGVPSKIYDLSASHPVRLR